MKIFYGIILLFFFLSCEKESVLEPKFQNVLLGKWSETYLWEFYYGEHLYHERTSIVEFEKDNFTVKIMPPIRDLFIKNDSIITGYRNDTLYSGFYEIVNDTIKFHETLSEEELKVNFSIENDSLKLSAIFEEEIIQNGDTLKVIPFGVFLWSYSNLKHQGKFRKE
ncbi:MAG: hypothetical protein GY936_00910 [Ignavibacteriae bacterium]|nr:hypothetical protein [Ignavibacteriota bacterium]